MCHVIPMPRPSGGVPVIRPAILTIPDYMLVDMGDEAGRFMLGQIAADVETETGIPHVWHLEHDDLMWRLEAAPVMH